MRRDNVFPVFGALFVAMLVTTSVTAIYAAGLGANSPTTEQTEEQDQAGAPPVGKIGSIRIQSSGQKIVEEDAARNKLAHASGETAPPAGSKPVKPKKPVVFGKTSEKSDIRPMRGGAEMGSYDSLGGSDEKQSAPKGKGAGKKEDSFD